MPARALSGALLILFGLGCGSACVFSAESGSTVRWGEAASNALVRKLEAGLQSHAVGNAGQLLHESQWSSDLQALWVRSQFSNSSPGRVTLSELPALELVFRLYEPGQAGLFPKLTYRKEQWYGSTFWTGPNWTRVGKDWHHPGENTPSVRCFRAPRAGQITITGRVRKLHLDGDGVRLSICQGTTPVWQAEIDGKDDRGVETQLSLRVDADEAIRFVVHKRGNIFCDTTYWDPVITYADGTTFRASDSFAKTQQGAGGWVYEMQREEMAEPQPFFVSLDAHGFLRRQQLLPGQSRRLTHEDALPVFVLTDGPDQSGVVIALNVEDSWVAQVQLTREGSLNFRFLVQNSGDNFVLDPGTVQELPNSLWTAYEGPWTTRFTWLHQTLQEAPPRAAVQHLSMRIRNAVALILDGVDRKPDWDLFLMMQAEWLREDRLNEDVDSYVRAVRDHWERAHALMAESFRDQPDRLAVFQARHAALMPPGTNARADLEFWRQRYGQTRLLKREVMLSHPLLDFDALLFAKRRPPTYSHLVGQYYGWRQQPGGGLFVLSDPGFSLRIRNLLGARLPPGSVLGPCLAPDARRVVFSFVASPDKPLDCRSISVNEAGADEAYFHLYEIHTDGTGLRQLTEGKYDDLMPAYLPDGGIAFCSTRRRSYSRCFHVQFSHRWHCYTLHRIDGDGRNLHPLSANDVNEWFPSVSSSGELLFARWDYIDRDAVTHQNLWVMWPDGTNPRALWGNATPTPHCVFQAKSVPDSRKIVFIASAHHALTAGPVCLLDPSVDNNSSLAAITRVTDGPFPEAESMEIPEYYESPWPLSERYFLVAYSPERLRFEGEHLQNPNPDHALGLYLIDDAGNRELIYRDPTIGSTSPIPLQLRPEPPVLARRRPAADSKPGEMGEIILANVYEGLPEAAPGSIRQLRIVQIFPKTTRDSNAPRIGFAGEENTRAILGTVPVQPDGSARFLVPARKPILFQALDQEGFAYQTMRSTTSVQPGETVSCIGCHENRMQAGPVRPLLALGRPASVIEPGELGGAPFSFVRMVQPVLDQHCVPCHGAPKTEGAIDLTGQPHQGFTRSYWALCGRPGSMDGANTNPDRAAAALVPFFGQRNQLQTTPPGGTYGALGSRLMRLLRAGHEDVQLSPAELRRLAAWIDCNAVFYGSYDSELQAKELAGKPIEMPAIQ